MDLGRSLVCSSSSLPLPSLFPPSSPLLYSFPPLPSSFSTLLLPPFSSTFLPFSSAPLLFLLLFCSLLFSAPLLFLALLLFPYSPLLCFPPLDLFFSALLLASWPLLSALLPSLSLPLLSFPLCLFPSSPSLSVSSPPLLLSFSLLLPTSLLLLF